jgi:TRAP-type uncharacterized transport system fused permease subunit
MLEIAPSSRPPLATLLGILVPLLVLAALLLRRATRIARRQMLIRALILGVVLTAASSALWSRRQTGTGTETARGWPRAVHTRWVPFERDSASGRAGLDWRGIAESGLVYATVAATLLALGSALVRRPRRVHSGGPSVLT